MLKVEALKVLVLPPISFQVLCGEALAVMGPSGVGKSMLLRAIADLDAAKIGQITLNGQALTQMSGPQWRAQVRYVPAEPGWWAETAAQHFAGIAGSDGDLAAQMASLKLKPGLLEQPIAQLSTGERMRLALLRAMADRPKVLLLDEPTGALDEDSTKRVEAIILHYLSAGGMAVIITHDPAQAKRLARTTLNLSEIP